MSQLVAKPPFATNATAVVANLDADEVDGKSAEEFPPKASLADLVPNGSLIFAVAAKDGTIAAACVRQR